MKDVNSEYTLNESSFIIKDNKIENLEILATSLYSKLNFIRGKYDKVFLKGTFNDSILIEDEIKVNQFFIESSTVKGRFDIKEGDFESIYFYRSVFFGLLVLNPTFFVNDPKRSGININSLTINSNSFEKNISLSHLYIESLDLSDNQFKKIFHFSSTLNKGKPVMLSTGGTNQGNIIIEGITLDLYISGVNLGNLYFKNISASHISISDFQNNGNTSFLNIISGDYFTIQDSSVGKLEFLNTDFKMFNEIVISNSNLDKINFSNYPFKIKSYSTNPNFGYGLEDKTLSKSNLKNVYNQLKKSAKNKGDIDTANKYQSLEYKYLLLDKGFGFDKLLLFLNWISNNHGRSWFRGVLFTLSVALICFYGYMNILGKEIIFQKFSKNYIVFISSFPKLELDEYLKNEKTWDISLIIWLSRIFISYGIYQTIAAFRKYGKS